MKQAHLVRTMALIGLSLATVLGSSGCIAAPPTIDCTNADVPTFAEVTAFQSCTSCHAEYGSYGGAVARAEEAQSAVAAGDMPQGGSLSEEQKTALYTWVQCGQPQ